MQKPRLKAIVTTLCLILCLSTSAQYELNQDIFENMRTDDKAAVIAVHVGTADNYAMRVCLGQFNDRLRSEFPKCDFREAWTSTNAISQCAEQNFVRQSLADVLEELAHDGYTRVLLQPSVLVSGAEQSFIQHEMEGFAERFRRIRLAPPLLVSLADYEKVILATAAEYGVEKSVNILECSNADGEDETCYAAMEYILHDKGYSNWFVVCPDGFPSPKSLIRRLKQQKNKRVNIIPFTFAAVNQTSESHIALCKALASAGYKVTQIEHSLGEVKGILSLFMEKAKHTQLYRTYTPVERKMLLK